VCVVCGGHLKPRAGSGGWGGSPERGHGGAKTTKKPSVGCCEPFRPPSAQAVRCPKPQGRGGGSADRPAQDWDEMDYATDTTQITEYVQEHQVPQIDEAVFILLRLGGGDGRRDGEGWRMQNAGWCVEVILLSRQAPQPWAFVSQLRMFPRHDSTKKCASTTGGRGARIRSKSCGIQGPQPESIVCYSSACAGRRNRKEEGSRRRGSLRGHHHVCVCSSHPSEALLGTDCCPAQPVWVWARDAPAGGADHWSMLSPEPLAQSGAVWAGGRWLSCGTNGWARTRLGFFLICLISLSPVPFARSLRTLHAGVAAGGSGGRRSRRMAKIRRPVASSAVIRHHLPPSATPSATRRLRPPARCPELVATWRIRGRGGPRTGRASVRELVGAHVGVRCCTFCGWGWCKMPDGAIPGPKRLTSRALTESWSEPASGMVVSGPCLGRTHTITSLIAHANSVKQPWHGSGSIRSSTNTSRGRIRGGILFVGSGGGLEIGSFSPSPAISASAPDGGTQ
jgi:hypothetical protein